MYVYYALRKICLAWPIMNYLEGDLVRRTFSFSEKEAELRCCWVVDGGKLSSHCVFWLLVSAARNEY